MTIGRESLEIVTHCWAKQLDLYAYLLQYQLSSLAMRKSDCKVTVTVVHASDDNLTKNVLFMMTDHLSNNGVRLYPLYVNHNQLFQRACGRNIAALNTKADVVWFTDCDYLFGDDSLSAALNTAQLNPAAVTYPRIVGANSNEKSGDDLIAKAKNRPSILLDYETGDFVQKRYGKAIGGIQIVPGSYCRQFGYLNDTKWTKPLAQARGFRSCRCDKHFRGAVGNSLSADIPNVFRIRHTAKGREHTKSLVRS